MSQQVGDLISFDESVDATYNIQQNAQAGREPDFRRVILSEIQYYQTSPASPNTTQDLSATNFDPLQDDTLQDILPLEDIFSSQQLNIFDDDFPPALPPKHYDKDKADAIVKRKSQFEIGNISLNDSLQASADISMPSTLKNEHTFHQFSSNDLYPDISHNINVSSNQSTPKVLEYSAGSKESTPLCRSAPDSIVHSALFKKSQDDNIDSFDPLSSGALVRGSELSAAKPYLKKGSVDDLMINAPTTNLLHFGNKTSDIGFKSRERKVKTLMPGKLVTFPDDSIDTPKTRPRQNQTLPLRPPPPKNRFSCPPAVLESEQKKKENKSDMEPKIDEDTNIFFKTGLFQKTEERNEEAVAFSKSIAKLRRIHIHTDKNTNLGYISAAKIKNKALLKTSMEISIHFDPDPETKHITCLLSCTPTDLIHKFFSMFHKGSSTYQLDIIAEQYLLKFAGRTSCLTDDCPLCDYVGIQECIKYGYDIELVLVRAGYINTDFKRDEEDDIDDGQCTYFNHYFNETDKTGFSISEQGLSVLLDTYNNEAGRLIQDVFETHKVSYLPERIIQVVKAISKSLAQVELLSIHDGVNLLLSLKRFSNRSQTVPASDRGRRNFNEYMNPIHFDRERFHTALQKLTQGVHSLIELYCKAFNTDFQMQGIKTQPKVDDEVYERIDPRTIDDKFSLNVATVHRIDPTWKKMYQEFEIEVALYYGGSLLCRPKTTSKIRLCVGFFEHIRFYELLEFDLAVRNIPRETKVTFQLFGLTFPKKGTDGKTSLGWVSCNVYDYQGFLLSGSRLFGLLSEVEFNPVATCATGYIQEQNTVILKTDFQIYHTEVLFPQPVLVTSSFTNGHSDFPEAELRYVRKVLRKDSRMLTDEERFVVWKCRYALCSLPSALKHVLVSCPAWDSVNVVEVHTLLSSWDALEPDEAIEFLQADFPDKTIRETAVLWLSNISEDDLVDYLPELVQAIKYEAYHDSALAQLLIRRSIASPRVAHFLFWHLKYYTGDLQFSQRFQIVLSGLLSACGRRMRSQLQQQDNLIVHLTSVSLKIKSIKETNRQIVLKNELSELNNSDVQFPVRSPMEPSLKFDNVLPEECSYFSSNTVPLKVSMHNSDRRGRNVDFIFKIGDDLRKDLVTILMFRVMNKLWLNEGLDLKMMLYNVLPTGPMSGLIQIVPNASTFREIHIQHGLTGSFKDNSLILWLQKFNLTEGDYHCSIENFTCSAAGYCVATYLLGIGDRHNDNIMLTKNGHLFHIDFSKFMGDVQKFGSISRDRVPFVLTPDMAYVINNGFTPTPNFQKFIEYCCEAFNILRRKKNVILNLLGLMVYSGIPYLSEKEDLLFIRRNLQLHLTDEEATMYFTRLIESSLSSRSTQLNFFIHNIAHMKNVSEATLGSSKTSPLFSFSNNKHTRDEDGAIESARIVDFQKRYLPEKHYVFVINVTRGNSQEPRFVFRRFEDFQELHAKLSYIFNVFTGTLLPELPARIFLGRSQIREVAHRRRFELDMYLVSLSKIKEIWSSDIVYTFLHSYIKDTEEARRFAEYVELLADGPRSRIGGKIKLSICHKNESLRVLVMHCSGLIPDRLQGLADPFVKIQVVPDPLNRYKRKTRICRKTLNPTFNETLEFDAGWDLLKKRVLQITVWDSSNIMDKEFLGGFNCYLSTMDVTKSRSNWHTLIDIQI